MLGGIFYVVRAKQSGKKKVIIFSLAFFWNVLLSRMSANSNNLITSTAPILTSTSSSQEIGSPTQVVTNDVIKSGDFEFSNAIIEPYEYSGSADVAGRLVKISYDVKNINNKSASPSGFSGISYGIKDGQSREFEEAALMIGAMDGNIKKRTTDNILPGSSNRVSLIFDVTANSEEFQLGIFHGFGSKQWLKTN
jgi:hypothetical protein